MAINVRSALKVLANSIPVAAITNFASTVQSYSLNLFAAPTAPLNLNNQRLVNVGTATAATDASTKGYVDTAAGNAQAAAVASAKTYTDATAASAQTASVAAAKTYTDTQDASTLASAKSYTDTNAISARDQAVASAKIYTDTQDAATLNAAKAYTDSKPPGTTTRESLGLGVADQPTFGGLTASAPGYGYTSLFQGDGGHTGFLTFNLKSGVRVGFLGYSSGTDIPFYVERPGAFFNFGNSAEALPPRINNVAIARISKGNFLCNGTSTTFDITHNMESTQFVFSLIDDSSQIVLVDAFPITQNVARVTFGQAPANGARYYWTVVG